MQHKKEKLEYRMYGFTNYQLSPIQTGIQFGHAVVEYSIKYQKTIEYKKWSTKDKTFIILNGGTTNDKTIGGLQHIVNFLKGYKIPHTTFREPDLNDTLTAVTFLVDERVWDSKKYPITLEEDKTPSEYKNVLGADWKAIIELKNFLSKCKLAS